MTEFNFADTVIATIERSRFGLANQAAADGDARGALNGETAADDLLAYLQQVLAKVPSADNESHAELTALIKQTVKDVAAEAEAEHIKSSRRERRIFFWRMMGLIAVFWLGVLALVLYHLPTIRWLISLNG